MMQNNSNNLEVLADPQNHHNLLLAEAIAWLHDMGKCDERHVQKEAQKEASYNKSDPANSLIEKYEYKKAHSSRVGTGYLELLGERVLLKDLIEKGEPQILHEPNNLWLIRTLGRCHAVAHTEKETFYCQLKQSMKDTRQSTPFGYESKPLMCLEARLDDLPFNQLSDHSAFKASVEKAFGYAIGDTQRPINEVTLWDWSSIVAAFYKAALAAALLEKEKKDPFAMRWQLLSVRLNGAAFLERVARIPDLLARRKLITDGLDKVQMLLEEKYPLGTEIYRDENGSTFLVPFVNSFLQLTNGKGEKLCTLIRDRFCAGTIKEDVSLQLHGEVIPILQFDNSNPWTRVGFGHEDPLPIAGHVMGLPASHADPGTVSSWWQDHKEDICTVCQLRPQGWEAQDYKEHYDRRSKRTTCPPGCQTCKALDRKACAICEQRREDRSKQWATKELNTTIWIDEIADAHGRIALVVGKFDLRHWLTGEMMFYPVEQTTLQVTNLGIPLAANQTYMIRGQDYVWDDSLQAFISIKDIQEKDAPHEGQTFHVDPNQPPDREKIKLMKVDLMRQGRLRVDRISKRQLMVETQTPARLHRVWETTQKFWEETQADLKSLIEFDPDKPDKIDQLLRLQIRGVFIPAQNTNNSLGDFHTYELKLGNVNLSVIYTRFTEAKEWEFLTADNLQRVALLLNPSGKLPEEYAIAADAVQNAIRKEGTLKIEEPTGYGSTNKTVGELRITKELIPVKIPYTPAITILAEPQTFMAIVPADKALSIARAIKNKYETEMGKVRNRLPLLVGIVFAGSRTPLPAILSAGRRMLGQSAGEDKWKVKQINRIVEPINIGLLPSKIEMSLEKGEQSLFLETGTVMGDGTTPDLWYPYWHIEEDINSTAPLNRNLQFKDKNDRIWIHAVALQEGAVVSFMPSRFDFEFLDTAARRFEVSYQNDKRRGSVHPCRPYYLEQLTEFKELWGMLSDCNGLTITQIHNLIGFIESQRMEWTGQDEGVFEQVVRDALHNAEWKTYPGKFEDLCHAATSGQLTDVVELYMQILKKKPDRDQEEGNQ